MTAPCRTGSHTPSRPSDWIACASPSTAAIRSPARWPASAMSRRRSPTNVPSPGVVSAGQAAAQWPAAFHVKSGQFAQRGNLVELSNRTEPLGEAGQHHPRSEEHQIIQGVPALPGECARPPRRWALGGGLQAARTSAADLASRSRQSHAAVSVVGRDSESDSRYVWN